ncbi:glycoside hydrolase family 43 protein [Microbacterium aurantiacum]|uniref:glycoside hydrolase family 43 protein n=1 Tax=Microbacterium aurantiacum TaxID=162393 RepID=UPI000C7FC3DB|nr:glycoside hydrolase family 43 protein [Microbacterium aurantiacum]
MSEQSVTAPAPRGRTRGSGAVRPIIPGFHPDPTICRVGEDYYLATSSFEYFPGAPIFHSRDLVSWRQIGNILDRRSQFRLGNGGPSTGIYAGTLRHHDGRFWFITTNVSEFGEGHLLVHTEDPTGPWSEPILIPEATGIDPDLAWDEHGTCYLTWHVLDFTRGGYGIRQAPIDLNTGRFLEPAYPVWQGSGMAAAEGPHLYRIGEHWYLVLAEGGTERGHSVTVARASSPRGPFQACPRNPVFTHRSSTHPVQNVGHADLVQTPDGDWAAVYLGARTRGSTPGFHVLGRETFLAGVDWSDGWPVFDEARYDVPEADSGFTDRFTDPRLDPRWVVPGGEPSAVASVDAGGLRLRLSERGTALLCARVRDLAWSAEVVLHGSGRFSLRVDERHWTGLTYDGDRVVAEVRIGEMRQVLATAAGPGGEVTLRIQSTSPLSAPVPIGNAGPDDIVLSLVHPHGDEELARLDGRYFSTEVASGFTGRMLALSALRDDSRVRQVSYQPIVTVVAQ